MTDWYYPTAFSLWGEEEKLAIARVIASGRFTMGDEVSCFEREFADWHGMKHGVMVNSGSSANLIAVAALFNKKDNPLQWGLRALVPAIAWSTTYAPLIQHGIKPTLVDCDETWNADWSTLDNSHAKFFGYSHRLVAACSILGNPARIYKEENSYVIEDNCESFGAMVDGHRCGTRGIMNTFSFFYSHQISAIEGGMILTNDDECAELCRMLRAHGWTRDIKKPETFSDEYDFRLMGYNVRPLEMHAAVAREQLKKQKEFTYRRQSNWQYWSDLTDNLPIKSPRMSGEYNPFGLAFTVKDEETRSRLVAALREQSIDCRLPTGGSFRMHEYGAPWRHQVTPNADRIHKTGLFLGNAPWDISDKIERAVKVIREVLL